MIFTNCECDEPITVGWESGMELGYYRVDCEKCGRIAMVECTSLGGVTHILEDESELEEFVKEKKLNTPAVAESEANEQAQSLTLREKNKYEQNPTMGKRV